MTASELKLSQDVNPAEIDTAASNPYHHWQKPEQPPELHQDELHVWRVQFDLEVEAPEHLYAVLSPEERERAGFFHFQKDRVRYVSTRGALRLLLARYLNLRAEDLRFETNAHGKPYLDGGDVRFNVSHSGQVALLAFARGREVGVDVEFLRPGLIDAHIAERYFSPAEVAALQALPPEQHREAFFNCWTRKEAYIKAVGQGLSIPLDSFEVSREPGKPAALLVTRPDAQEARRWSMFALQLGPGYAGAVVVQGQDVDLRCWEWTG